MRLSNLIAPNEGLTLHGEDLSRRSVAKADRDIGGVTADSRQVKEGFLFAAVPGTQQDGRKFLDDAIAKGAVAVLVPEDTNRASIPANVSVITAPDVRLALSGIAARYYPRQPRMIAAVTGTSGKTSTAEFTRGLWSACGHQAASIGTLGLITPTEKRYGSLTTPDSVALHQILDEIAEQNITHAAMEASSHGLDLRRLDHVRISVAAFTNLSRDHLDYHDSMKSYFKAKLRLFNEVLPESNTAVLNADVPEYDELSRVCKARKHKIISYGKKGREITIKDYRPHPRGQIVRFELLGKNREVLLPVIGEFQVWNSLCALGIVIGSGDDADKSASALEKLTGVPGRLEFIGTSASGGAVFVDYAHKPGALENVLNGLRPHVAAHPGARLHVVFGCGGNRDKGKRPLMGGIAQKLADEVIVTDDNPRREEPSEIRKEILAGCTPGPHLREIGDRAKAIETGIENMREGDVLVIAGKGHEPGQIVGDKVLPFDDGDVARRVLRGGKT
jgi:UDP-N-acetylmuramoyl-L-alanyl-D-glutamate--2,6-diaminopimelate ligase